MVDNFDIGGELRGDYLPENPYEYTTVEVAAELAKGTFTSRKKQWLLDKLQLDNSLSDKEKNSMVEGIISAQT